MFKRNKKKTGCETPKYSHFSMAPGPKPEYTFPNPCYIPPASTPRYNPPPMPPIKPAKQKENKIMNKTMYGLNLYIPFEELDAYIHERIDAKYKNQTFIPVKVEINELDLSIDIKLLSASSVEIDNCRYKLDLSALPKDSKPKRGLRANAGILDDHGGSELDDIRSGKGLSRLYATLDPNKPLTSGIRKDVIQ